MAFIVPPGGFAGFSQMTPASKRALSTGGASRGRRRRKPKKPNARKINARSARVNNRFRKKIARAQKNPKFGSPAWRKKYGLDKKR